MISDFEINQKFFCAVPSSALKVANAYKKKSPVVRFQYLFLLIF